MLPPPSPNVSSRPTPLVAGALICGVAVLATILEGAFWIAFWSEISDLASAEISDPEAEEVFSVYRSMLILVVAGSSLLGFLTMGGAIAAMTGKNWGRIIVWVAGGVVALWHLCCSGYTLLFRAVFAQVSNEAQAQDGYDPTQDVSMWMVDAAIISGFIARGIVVIRFNRVGCVLGRICKRVVRVVHLGALVLIPFENGSKVLARLGVAFAVAFNCAIHGVSGFLNVAARQSENMLKLAVHLTKRREYWALDYAAMRAFSSRK